MSIQASDFSYPDAVSEVGPMRRIAVVDDDVRIGRLMRAFLEGRGFQCEVLTDALGLYRVLGEKRIDAVISDIVMPGISGLELLRSVRRIAPHVPVILITGFPKMDFVREAMKEGAVDFLQKPVDLDDLEKNLRMALERSSAAVESAEPAAPPALPVQVSQPLSRSEKRLARQVRRRMREKEWRHWSWTDRLTLPLRSMTEEVKMHPWFYALAMVAIMAASLLSLQTFKVVTASAARPGLFELLERGVTALEEDNRLDRQNPR